MVGVKIQDLEVHSRWVQLFDIPSQNYNVSMKFLARETVLPDLCRMFSSGKPVYVMTKDEYEEYLALKHEKEVREAETKEEETMKNKIDGVTEVLTIEDLPRQVRQVIRGESEYVDAAWCPSCAALFRKGTPNWGREVCGHCGQLLEWPEE